MIGLAAGFLPALPWPDYLGLDAFASDAEAGGRPAAPARPPARADRRAHLSSALGYTSRRIARTRVLHSPIMTHRPTPSSPREPATSPSIAAELFVDCLENEGVEYVFGIPGEETLDLSEALDRSQHITFVPTRHEQGAAFMADAYGRLTGKPGVCLATLGPGASNLATGIGDANLDNAPLVALTGQIGLAGMHKETRTSSSTPSRCCAP